MNSQLMSLMSELEENLTATFDSDIPNSNGGNSLYDEIRYWQKRQESRRNNDTATQYCEAFAPLSEKLDLMEERSLDELTEFVEAAEDCIDALWRSVDPYPETRMKHLINSIGSINFVACASCIKRRSLASLKKFMRPEFRPQICVFFF
ncbi:unnamed protein product [Toxocara canis]|uniref:DUF1394 domain-containing protein n=1 Tax=Toxocara canis TaxID=6265 RepID=A0A183U980_TOXCA|nr:unnamed protein product [Toxocara canis]